MKYLIIPIALFISLNVFSQLSDTQQNEIDSFFESWNEGDHPGGVIGIMKGGEIQYTKAYGMSDLNVKQPNTVDTYFNIASISKQFTAIGIVLLEQEGKLSYDDEIQIYLPEIPKFEHKITIRHLMHHTSGLRSLHGVLEMAGWRQNDPRSTEDLFRIMKNQKDLNFAPGDEYLYCNTGYNFMARIIENITEEDFIPWIKQHVFDPLGMHKTYVEEHYWDVVPGNANSYYQEKDGFSNAVPFWGYMGAGNAHTNVNDLLMWYRNFSRPKVGWEKAFEALQTKDTLNDGAINNYAFGVMMDDYHGVNRIQHGGGIGGFRAFACSYPDQDISIVLLTNFTSSDVRGKVGKVSDKLLWLSQGDDGTTTEIREDIKIKRKKLKMYEHHFWNEQKKFSRKIYLRDDTLWYHISEGNESALRPVGEHEFQMISSNAPIIKFEFLNPKSPTIIVGYGKPGAGDFISFTPIEPTLEILNEYTGSFYSSELDTKYTLRLEDDKLIASQKRLGDLKVELMNANALSADWPLGVLSVQRDADTKITGFYASNGRVRNVWFEKIEE
ncbi:MAG: beta-lactamase family protein [Crocinitomicaceae bacterium]|nr:beta-lactamase family protein [Crocinitomicaceae bacterium]